MYLSSRHEHDHFPVQWAYGGEATVPACINCHDLKDRVNLGNWPSSGAFSGLTELLEALLPSGLLEEYAAGPWVGGYPDWLSPYLRWATVEHQWSSLSPVARVLYGKLVTIEELRTDSACVS